MDDPWGSPWATTDTTTAPSTSPSKNRLEPPPPAFLSTPNSLTIPSSQSAWLDDDPYGGWASHDPGQATNTSPWIWGNEAAPIEGLTPSYEPRRKSSIPRWPRSQSPSPALGSRITPNIVSPGQPSPDPWAHHVSTYTRDDPEPVAQLPQIPDVLPPVLESAQVGLGLTDSTNPFEQDFVTHEPIATQFADPMPNSTHEHLKFSDTPLSDFFPPTTKHGDEAAPSSASALSEDGGDNDEATSIEDNAAPKTSQRKASGKVLELVEMYDGIAKRRATTPERIIPRRSSSREPKTAASDISDHGSEADKQPEADKEVQPRGSIYVDSRSLPDDRDESIGHIDEVPKSIRPDHDPFDIDLGKLNLLLPGTSEEVSVPSQDVSDRIVHDSFTSIPERKMWYRLSRNESLRKHNAGDDDNYVRINWTNSTLRQETLKTVRRWIEEDSFGGRAFRSGSAGNTGSKNFGWDATTAASPVDLDRVFGRKQKRQPAVPRPTSTGGLPPLSTFPMVPASTGNTPISAQANGNWEGLAAFGWSSGAGDTKQVTEANASRPSAPSIPIPLAFTGFDNKPKSHASLPAFIKPIAPTPPTLKATSPAAEEAGEAEDEWGDMVSPTTAEATDSASLPKTSWDSFSTNPLPEVASMPPSDSFTTSNPDSDVLRTGFYDDGNFRDKSGRGIVGSGMSPTPAPTQAQAGVPDVPQSQDGFSDISRSASTVKRLASKNLSDPQTASSSGEAGFSAEGTVKTGLTTGLHTGSTTQPLNAHSTEGFDIVHRFVRNLPDLSYMLR
ncbi:hypothetical protein CGRA01v4_04229 [Colletotrichum graminicola]|uniref:Glucan 1, 4-alpha-glucosidase n=1 Tax=Colletotrichum graminicola (strain M1.001 / M2 / FGSC 10212) TaxID=645133 RepID=E3QVH2_COLGM|nr:uncharacterized protein GLRG_10004 [Colletotrichum graminicola M1.001]EFQ34860.1 hypothetical protein GLRG_10004 [Colletotrichum graminicola M1.001]WDK12948.1 hypothetical protein CGRA01v4_04229 [Colletotrichum graminicola]